MSEARDVRRGFGCNGRKARNETVIDAGGTSSAERGEGKQRNGTSAIKTRNNELAIQRQKHSSGSSPPNEDEGVQKQLSGVARSRSAKPDPRTEEEERRCSEERAGERDAHAPPSGHVLRLPLNHLLREAEAEEELRCANLRERWMRSPGPTVWSRRREGASEEGLVSRGIRDRRVNHGSSGNASAPRRAKLSNITGARQSSGATRVSAACAFASSIRASNVLGSSSSSLV